RRCDPPAPRVPPFREPPAPAAVQEEGARAPVGQAFEPDLLGVRLESLTYGGGGAAMVYLLILGAVLVLAAVALLVLRAVHAAGPPVASRAQTAFADQRPRLLEAFQTAAAAAGKPRGLRWKALEWSPGVEFARERRTDRLAALVGVTVHFEAPPGG